MHSMKRQQCLSSEKTTSNLYSPLTHLNMHRVLQRSSSPVYRNAMNNSSLINAMLQNRWLQQSKPVIWFCLLPNSLVPHDGVEPLFRQIVNQVELFSLTKSLWEVQLVILFEQ